MFLNKYRLFPGHSQKNNWLWPFILVLLLGSFFIFDRGPKPTVNMDKPENFWVRVLIFSDLQKLTVSADEGFEVIKPDGSKVPFDSSDEFTIEPSQYGFKIDQGIFPATELSFKPRSPFVINADGFVCRGYLRIYINSEGKLDVINHIPLEAYIASVIGAEMPRYWHASALKAQAVASRTYCLYHKKTYGPNRNYDVRRTQANQVYNGLASEFSASLEAARETEGIVMLSEKKIFPAYFSSSCGGHTEDAANVFGKGFSNLKGKPCPYCIKVARSKDYQWKPYKISNEDLTEKLCAKYDTIKPLGPITDIKARRKRNFGQVSRWTNVELTGNTGKTITLRAEDLRLSIDSTGMKIKGTIFELANLDGFWVFYSGQGFGHGVGLCQCGAQQLAREDYTWQQIINYYYSNPELVKYY